jgi:hypothetical protein
VNAFLKANGLRGARSARQWIDHFYFEPTGPLGLALCRVWIYGFLLRDCGRFEYADWADATPGMWKPIWLFAWLPGPVVSSDFMAGAQLAFMAALALCCVGLCFRWSSIAAFALGLVVYGLPHCFGKVGHAQTLSVFVLGIFALSHAAHAWSLDAWISRLRGRPVPPQISSEYQWPVRLMQALMATVFLAAGLAKLRHSGLAWIYSDHMQNTLLECYYLGKTPPTRLGPWVAQQPLLPNLLAGVSLVAELTAPVALLSRRYRWLVIPSLAGMQLGIYYVMGISFWHYLALYFVWVEWNELAAWIGNRRKTAALPVLESKLRKAKVPAEPGVLSHG